MSKRGDMQINLVVTILIAVVAFYFLLSFGSKLLAANYNQEGIGAERYIESLKEKIESVGSENNVFRIIDNGKNSGVDRLDYYLVYFGSAVRILGKSLDGVDDDLKFIYSGGIDPKNLICVCYFYDGDVRCGDCEELDGSTEIKALESGSFVSAGEGYWVAGEGVKLEVSKSGEVYVFIERK